MSKNHGQTMPVSFSQNFLISQKTIERLLRLTNINKCDTVLEIGTGKGHITKALLRRCGRVVAYEIDPKLSVPLRKKFSDSPNLHLMGSDFLRSNLPPAKYKVFSNIPFMITTNIIKKLTQDKNPPQDAWLVIYQTPNINRTSSCKINPPPTKWGSIIHSMAMPFSMLVEIWQEIIEYLPYIDFSTYGR